MLREKLIAHHAPKHPLKPDQFRWRSREISRLEGLSDAVFGFAITLLIVALEVPRTSGELLETMRGFAAFAFTFTVLYVLWYRQFIFFRRYGLEDRTTVVLNGALLFVILFFTFPLKFLFTTLMNKLLGFGGMVRLPNGTLEKAIEPGHLPLMLGIYGLGSMTIFGIFALFYVHAYRQRHELDLNELERLDTLLAIRVFSLASGVGLTTVVYATAMGLLRGKGYEDQMGYAFMGAMALYALWISRFRRTQRGRRRELLDRMAALHGEANVDQS
jgi:uncharacterized membrane protein